MKRIIRGSLLGLLIVLLVAVPVLAAYYANIDVTESGGTSYNELAMNQSLNVTYLVANGYISPTGMDTRITDEDLNVQPHMLAEDKVMWVSDLAGNTSTQFIFFMGQDALSSFPTITGHGGYVTIPDDADLEPGDVYAFGIVGYVDTDAGANKNIIRKDGAVVFSITDDEELTFSVTGGNSLSTWGIESGYMTIMIYCDGIDMWLEIDDLEEDRTDASAIPNTGNNWVLFEDDVMPYVSYYGEWVAE